MHDTISEIAINFSRLDGAIINEAFKTLKQRVISENFLVSPVLFFFPDGTGVDEGNPRTFTALCLRNNVDPNYIARRLWGMLSDERKALVTRVLKKEGFL